MPCGNSRYIGRTSFHSAKCSTARADRGVHRAEYAGRRDLVGVDAALDFPLFFTLPAFAKGFAPPTNVIDVYRRRKQVERDVLSSHGEAGRFFVTFLDNHDMKERFRGASTDGRTRSTRRSSWRSRRCSRCREYRASTTEPSRVSRPRRRRPVRARGALGKPGGFDTNHPFFKSIKLLSEIRNAQPALRYGRLYFRPISVTDDASARRRSPQASSPSPGFSDREVVVVANANTQAGFKGRVLVDFFINNDGEQFRVLNDATAARPGVVETRSGLEIDEIDGGTTSGPARMIEVNLRPMEVQVLAK
jgi:hypothetical protein